MLIWYIFRDWQDRCVLTLITRLSWQLRLIEVQQESAMEADGLYLTAYMECQGVGEGGNALLGKLWSNEMPSLTDPCLYWNVTHNSFGLCEFFCTDFNQNAYYENILLFLTFYGNLITQC